MGPSVVFFRNFRDCFRTVRAEFRGCFQIVRVEILGLFLDSLDRIFKTIFRQSGTELRFGFDPGTDVLGFCGVSWYHNNSVTNREGTKRCPVVYGSKIWTILYVIIRKINKMLLYVKFMLICACEMY